MIWKAVIQDLSNTNTYFKIFQIPNISEDAALTSLLCLTDLASCRMSIFQDIATRKTFVKNFSEKLIYLFQNSYDKLCSNRKLTKSFLRVIFKFEMNFGLRSFGFKEPEDLTALLKYVTELSRFTQSAIKSGRQYLRQQFVANLAVFGRIRSEISHVQISPESEILAHIKEIIAVYIDETVNDLAPHDHEEEEEECK